MRFGILMMCVSLFFPGGSGQHSKTFDFSGNALIRLKIQCDDTHAATLGFIVADGARGLTQGDVMCLPNAAIMGEAGMVCAATPAAIAPTLLPGSGGAPLVACPPWVWESRCLQSYGDTTNGKDELYVEMLLAMAGAAWSAEFPFEGNMLFGFVFLILVVATLQGRVQAGAMLIAVASDLVRVVAGVASSMPQLASEAEQEGLCAGAQEVETDRLLTVSEWTEEAPGAAGTDPWARWRPNPWARCRWCSVRTRRTQSLCGSS